VTLEVFKSSAKLDVVLAATRAPDTAAVSVHGQTPISAIYRPVLRLTAPPPVDGWELHPGQDNVLRATGALTVAANVDFHVAVNTDTFSDGFLTQATGGVYHTPEQRLRRRLRIATGDGPA